MSVIPHKPKLSITERNILIREHYTQRQARLIRAVLTHNEMQVIDDTDSMDYRDYLAVTKTRQARKKPERIKRFQRLEPRPEYKHDYFQREIAWLSEMKYLVGTRKREPTTDDIRQEIKENHISETFRAYYCIRFPDKVQPKT